MVRIALDSGHGDFTAGKRVPLSMGYGNISEWELNRRITERQIQLLNQYENVEILRLDDPTGQRDIPLKTRTDKANKFGADILISNHHNAGIGGGGGGGLTVFRYPNSNLFTKAMQKALYDSLIKSGAVKGNRSKPLDEANFHMVRKSNMAAVLVEYAFMDSVVDIKEIMKTDFATNMAKGVVNWIAKHYNLRKKKNAKPSIPTNNDLFRVQVGAFKNIQNATNLKNKLERDKYDTYLIRVKDLFKVQVGAFSKIENAEKLANELKSKGYDIYVTTKSGQSINTSKTPSKPKVPQIDVDGYWGKRTTEALQRTLGTPVDGIISGQFVNDVTKNIMGTTYTHSKGSPMVRELQKRIGVKADGYLGSITIRALQKYLGTPVDGFISKPSIMVKELQKRLNRGTI